MPVQGSFESTATESDRALPATLLFGGGLLIVSGLAQSAWAVALLGAGAVALWVGNIAFALAMVVFALGMGRSGSIVARRPLGVAALITFGVAPWLLWIGFSFVPGGPAPGMFLLLVVQIVSFVSGFVSVIAIIRARVLPPGWRMVPLWAFIVATLAELLEIFRLFYGATTWFWNLMSLEVLTALPLMIPVVVLVVGVLAVVLGARRRSTPTTPSGDERRAVGTE